MITVCNGILMYGKSACGRLWKYAYLKRQGLWDISRKQTPDSQASKNGLFMIMSKNIHNTDKLTNLVSNYEDVFLALKFHDNWF